MNVLTPIQADFPLGGDGSSGGPRLPSPTPIQQLHAALFRQRYPALGAIGGALAIGLLVTTAMPQKYTSSASIVLEQQAPQVIAVPDLDPQRNAQDAERFLQTQTDLVRSQTLANAVADQLKVERNPALLDALSVDEDADRRRGSVVAALMTGVQVDLGLNTRLAKISFTSRDPVTSANVANAYAQQLVAANLKAKTGTSSRAAEYLKNQLVEAKKKLEDSERSMLSYARSAGLTTADVTGQGNGQGTVSFSSMLLGPLSQSMADATARRIAAQQQWLQYQGASAMALPQVQDNRGVQDMLAQKARMAATQADENERYTGEYPTATAAQINSFDREINAIAASVRQSYYDNYRGTIQQEQQIQQALNGLRSTIMAERDRSVGYNSLEREVAITKAFYDGLLQRYKEVVAASGAPSANITILDKAIASLDPTSPNLIRNLALALILGLLAAIGIVIVRERSHSFIRSTFDLGEVDYLPFLGVIPVAGKGEKIEDALDDPRSPQSEAYNSAAVSVQRMDDGKMPRTLLVTSSAESEGKSTTAVGLARSLSRLGSRVLLVDGDLRHPSLGEMLGEPAGPGLAEALAGTAQPQSIIRNLPELRFDLVLAGTARENPIGLLAERNLAPVLDQLSANYDIVLVDGPPIMGLADAVILSGSTDAVIVTIEANRTETSQLGLALSRLRGIKSLGAVLTKFDAKEAGVAYGDAPYYSYA